MDEKLRYFGLEKNAKVRDNWSSWNVVGPLCFICCSFCFSVVLLVAGDEFCFVFFMFVMMFGVDQARILHCFGVGDWWMANVAIYEGASYIEKLSFYIRVWIGFSAFVCLGSFQVCWCMFAMGFSCNKFSRVGLWGMNALTPWNF
jgi:hypothetical protein